MNSTLSKPKPQTRQSLVTLRSIVPDDAYTAGPLGTTREGSGVVIRENGLVLTMGYLIMEADEVWITRPDGKVIAGHALAVDQESGFGLVQALGPLDLPALALGDSSKAKIGDAISMIDGNGEETDGEIVARQEFAGYWEYLVDDALFTAPAHSSWGGAALLDAKGALLGIGSLRLQMASGSDVADINMTVPIDLLKPVLDDLIRRGGVQKPARPWLGAFTAEHNGDVVVMSVAQGGPADRAGLQTGDIISDLRDRQVDSLADFYRTLWASGPVGTEFPMRVVREGRETWLRVKSGDRASVLRKPQLQ